MTTFAKLQTLKTKHGLGRLPARDLRDHRFPAAAALPRSLAGVTTRTWRIGPIKDQGKTSECVAYAGLQFLRSAPVRNKPPIPLTENWFYKQCQTLDEWPGEGYDGTSVRASAKLMQRLGYVADYLWAFDLSTAIKWILSRGPMQLGTIWTWSMFEPDDRGFIHVDTDPGAVAGGHSTTLIGVDTKRKRAEIANSWGTTWGNKGRAFLSFADLEILIHADGEALAASEILAGPPTIDPI